MPNSVERNHLKSYARENILVGLLGLTICVCAGLGRIGYIPLPTG